MVLHDVADNAKLVEVAAAAHGPERLLEGNDNVGNVVPVPDRLKDSVGKPWEGGREGGRVRIKREGGREGGREGKSEGGMR